MHTTHTLALPGGRFITLGARPCIMGILNVTPDSFSDGSLHPDLAAAQRHAVSMVQDGADIIDVGGESTRPGSEPVPVQEELDRVMPVLASLADLGVPRSIDTYKALVADQALQAGASIINDVHGLQGDPDMAAVAALYGVPVIAMHWERQRRPEYSLLDSMRRYFDRTIEIAQRAGVSNQALILDPGFGFGKSLSENYTLLAALKSLYPDYPMLIGLSRKAMIGRLLDLPVGQRLYGTLAANVVAYQQGGHIFRVHDVRPHREALAVAQAATYGAEGAAT